jgi:hypothetical protein
MFKSRINGSWFKEFMNTLDEFHYFVSGFAIGIIIGIFAGIGITYLIIKLFVG